MLRVPFQAFTSVACFEEKIRSSSRRLLDSQASLDPQTRVTESSPLLDGLANSRVAFSTRLFSVDPEEPMRRLVLSGFFIIRLERDPAAKTPLPSESPSAAGLRCDAKTEAASQLFPQHAIFVPPLAIDDLLFRRTENFPQSGEGLLPPRALIQLLALRESATGSAFREEENDALRFLKTHRDARGLEVDGRAAELAVQAASLARQQRWVRALLNLQEEADALEARLQRQKQSKVTDSAFPLPKKRLRILLRPSSQREIPCGRGDIAVFAGRSGEGFRFDAAVVPSALRLFLRRPVFGLLPLYVQRVFMGYRRANVLLARDSASGESLLVPGGLQTAVNTK